MENKTIVLDLDETLIYSEIYPIWDNTDEEDLNHSNFVNFDFTILNQNYYIYKRPYLDIFIKHIFDNYENIIIWTASTKDYAQEICKKIFEDKHYKLLTRLDCELISNKYIKDIEKIGLKQEHTITLDDRLYSFKTNNSNNIIIKPFYGSINDKELLNLITFNIV